MAEQGLRRLLLLGAGYTLVTLLFVTLRAAEAISWTWYWVFSPLWLPVILAGIGFVSFILVKAHHRLR